MKSTTGGQHAFAQIPSVSAPRSSFNRSHGYKTTFDAGFLVPIFCDEALPGDTFKLNVTTFARLATPLHPFMDNAFLDVFFFAVPYRLVWDNFKKFMGEQYDPGDSTDFTVPVMSAPGGGYLVGDLQDYFGIPTGIGGLTHSALPLRSYQLIFNEWFRDENLVDSVNVARNDGPDGLSQYTLLRRGKRHDYFTSCLPWAQKGDPVTMSLGVSAPVVFPTDGNVNRLASTSAPIFEDSAGNDLGGIQYANSGTSAFWNTNTGGVGQGPAIWTSPGLKATLTSVTDAYTDLSLATSATINQLREAFQIQKLLERDARGGTRYTEIVLSHFGVSSPDARLQRPEYLGSGTVSLNVNPVTQQSATDDGSGSTSATPQGNLAAFGVASSGGIGFVKSFTEHSVIIGLVSARADLNYQQGMERMWNRRTRYDFYWPSFAHLGEQSVLNKEIYAQNDANDDLVFGYQERWAEYRYKPSLITGLFRSTAAASLDTWHLAQEFTALPVLSQTFIEENPPFDRVIAVTTEPHFLFDSFFQYTCVRPMPTYSVPGLVDHF